MSDEDGLPKLRYLGSYEGGTHNLVIPRAALERVEQSFAAEPRRRGEDPLGGDRRCHTRTRHATSASDAASHEGAQNVWECEMSSLATLSRPASVRSRVAEAVELLQRTADVIWKLQDEVNAERSARSEAAVQAAEVRLA